MVVLNDLDRFHLAGDVIARVRGLNKRASAAKRFLHERLRAHQDYICRNGEDLPEIKNWRWDKDA
jgi:xylulose-5-phosphate/fructose-6-phosphate phosphoketolase